MLIPPKKICIVSCFSQHLSWFSKQALTPTLSAYPSLAAAPHAEMLAAEAEATSDSLPHWLEQVLEAGEEVEGPAAPELPEQADVAAGSGAQDSAMSRR